MVKNNNFCFSNSSRHRLKKGSFKMYSVGFFFLGLLTGIPSMDIENSYLFQKAHNRKERVVNCIHSNE